MSNKITNAKTHNVLHGSNYALRAERLRKHEDNGTLATARRQLQNTKGLFTPIPVEYKGIDISAKGII